MYADDPPCVTLKVGGSLYDLPDLGQRLRTFIEGLDAGRVLLFPGGGAAADVIRRLDADHRLGEETAHRLALRTLSVNAHFLHAVLPDFEVVETLPGVPRLAIADPFALLDGDDALPRRWDVTSDSLSVQCSRLAGARELIVLKSVPFQGSTEEAVAQGIVDPYFTEALRRFPIDVRFACLR